MKTKVMLIATAVTFAAYGLAFAEGPKWGTPRGDPQALATADYGGVTYSTCSFCGPLGPITFSTVVAPNSVTDGAKLTLKGVFYGVLFSSGSSTPTDFVDVFDATATSNASLLIPIARLYNINTATSPLQGGNASGFSGPPKPIRFTKGIVVRPNSSAYNGITTLFYREP